MDDEDDLQLGERRTALAPARAGRPSPTGVELPGEGSIVDGKYRVERVLGAGGMGVVVAAMHLGLDERVALKFVKLSAPGDELVERLRREARIAFRIKSQHVARLLDVGTLPSGSPYLVMEYLDGKDLARVLGERGPLPIQEAVDDVLQACEAMAEAHGLSVVHRDLKPSNLFLTRGADGKPLVKVLDFGIAKAVGGLDGQVDSITSACAVLGSPLYMSPEQVRGARNVDARSDVWSLGVIVHELVAGAPPFPPGPASAVCAAIAADAPETLRARRPDAPAQLEAAVLRCLEKDPARRFASVGAFAAAIAPFASPASARVLERIASLEAGRELPSASPSSPVADPERVVAESSVTVSAWNAHGPAPSKPFRLAVGVALAAAAIVAGSVLRSRPSSPSLADATPARGDATALLGSAAADRGGPPATPTVAEAPAPTSTPTAAPGAPAPPTPNRPGAPSRPARGAATVTPAAAPSVPVAATVAPTVAPAPPPAPSVQGDDLEERATSRRH